MPQTEELGTTTYDFYTSGYGLNQIKKETGPNGITKEYTYDQYNQILSMIETIVNQQLTTSYTYDAHGNLTSMTYPSGFTIKYNYNSTGYLSTVTNNAGTLNIFSSQYINAMGQYTAYSLGNGYTTSKSYDSYGFPTNISCSGVQNLDLNFNIYSGNLTSRTDHMNSVSESFSYDNLDRLTGSTVGTNPTIAVNYESNGNISTKTDAGTYTYDGSKINAVTNVSDPNNLALMNQYVTYTPFNTVSEITESTYDLSFTYGPDEDRKKTVLTSSGSTVKTRYYSGSYEKETDASGNITEIHYIQGGDGLCAIYVIINGGTGSYYYVYKDHLGSILTLTDASGVIAARQSYDAWGRDRNPYDWTYTTNTFSNPAWLTRGFTSHEMLPEFSLINMNARVYDPIVARILSADNYLQDASATQNYNRYSYVMNNPLKFTDPSGNFIWMIPVAAMVVFAYLGGTAANGGQLNPVKWNWQSGTTYAGIGIGAAAGFLGGWAAATWAPIIAGTGGTFGASGVYATYTVVGAAAGAAAGFATGFGTGYLATGNLHEALSIGGTYAEVGLAIGTVAGGIAGLAVGYQPVVPKYSIDMTLVNSYASTSSEPDLSAFNYSMSQPQGHYTVWNETNSTIYFKPESDETINNITYKDAGSYPIPPYSKIYAPIDGLNIAGVVWKLTDGYNYVDVISATSIETHYTYPWYYGYYLYKGGIQTTLPAANWQNLWDAIHH